MKNKLLENEELDNVLPEDDLEDNEDLPEEVDPIEVDVDEDDPEYNDLPDAEASLDELEDALDDGVPEVDIVKSYMDGDIDRVKQAIHDRVVATVRDSI